MEFQGFDLIQIFDYDPDLLEGLDDATAERVRQGVAARRMWTEPGTWRPRFGPGETRGHLGLLVIDGLLVRTVRLAGRGASEVVGPGDLIRPWDADDALGSVESTSEWLVLQPTTFAGLDEQFGRHIAAWPTITAQLLSRSVRRCRTLVHQAAIAHVRHAEKRVLLALWQLGDRWGKVTTDGVVVPVPLTHQLLAQITCLQRPTVSAALGHLSAAGEVSPRRDGGWVLHGAPPDLPPGDAESWVAARRRPPAGRGMAEAAPEDVIRMTFSPIG
jgi:CRP/FNR family transcriptional regulator, cyclic AMP receptor protein